MFEERISGNEVGLEAAVLEHLHIAEEGVRRHRQADVPKLMEADVPLEDFKTDTHRLRPGELAGNEECKAVLVLFDDVEVMVLKRYSGALVYLFEQGFTEHGNHPLDSILCVLRVKIGLVEHVPSSGVVWVHEVDKDERTIR